MKTFKQFLNEIERSKLPVLTGFAVLNGERAVRLLVEGKWVQRGIKGKIRIDQPSHGVGQAHAHLFALKGNEYGVVNFDGTGSHGTPKNSRIQDDHADALRKAGFKIPPDNLVEWVAVADGQQFLVE